ncbi:uncharacterized protein V6R79_024332 [Siganus canaliculatus]
MKETAETAREDDAGDKKTFFFGEMGQMTWMDLGLLSTDLNRNPTFWQGENKDKGNI